MTTHSERATGVAASERREHERVRVAEWHRQHAASLEAFARGLLRDAVAAEDVVQTVFRKAIEKPPIGENERAWFFQVARNECMTLLRRRSVERRATSQTPLPRPTPAAASVAEADETFRRLRTAIRSLPVEDQHLLTRRFFHRESYEQIAEACQTNPSTLSTRLHRILKKLKAIDPNLDPSFE